MSKNITGGILPILAAALTIGLATPQSASAHCDTMNGPVVTAAEQALESGDVSGVLIWVHKKDEAEITKAFKNTLVVRQLSPEAKKLADMYFFETLVRIHRAGEGVAYTGLKPAETEIEPGIAAADRALKTGSASELVKHLNDAIHQGLHSEFTNAMSKKNYKKNDVAAGRDYVKSYVEFIHYVERLFQAAAKPAEGHMHDAGQTGAHQDVH